MKQKTIFISLIFLSLLLTLGGCTINPPTKTQKPEVDEDSLLTEQNKKDDNINVDKIYVADRFKIDRAKDDRKFTGTIQVDLSTFDCNLIHDYCPEVSAPIRGNLNFSDISKKEILDLIKRDDVFGVKLLQSEDLMVPF